MRKKDAPQKQFAYKLPKICRPADDNLSKQWSVDYGVWSEQKGKLVRKRVVLVGVTVDERISHAEQIIKALEKLLKSGQMVVNEVPELEVVAQADADSQDTIATLPILTAKEQYLATVKSTLSGNSYKPYRSALRGLEAYLKRHNRENARLIDFDGVDAVTMLEELIVSGKVSNRTRNNYKGHLTTFFLYWMERDRSKTLTNPFHGKRKLPTAKFKHQAYTDRQREAYRLECEKTGQADLLLFCQFIYYSFFRPGEELRRMRVRDIKPDTLYVPADVAKDNESEHVQIPDGLQALIVHYNLRSYPEHYYVFSYDDKPGPDLLGPKYFYRRHIKVKAAIGLANSRHDLYSWKHTGAIALWNASKDIELLRLHCRHSDIKQTLEYLRDLGMKLSYSDEIKKFPVF